MVEIYRKTHKRAVESRSKMSKSVMGCRKGVSTLTSQNQIVGAVSLVGKKFKSSLRKSRQLGASPIAECGREKNKITRQLFSHQSSRTEGSGYGLMGPETGR